MAPETLRDRASQVDQAESSMHAAFSDGARSDANDSIESMAGDVRNIGGHTTARSHGAAPPRPRVWYRAAATEYGVSEHLLEALHQVESSASADSCIANMEGSGATGPFQFKVATFGQFGVDANHDGTRDICAFTDSLFSAARYLREIGADADPTSHGTRKALARYGTDVSQVVSLTEEYRDRDSLIASIGSTAHN